MGDPAFLSPRADTQKAGSARHRSVAVDHGDAAPGGGLDSGRLESFGAGFGSDFSRVPVHGSRLFGTDMPAVRLHPESSRASGRVHAVTEGNHVYFAAGHFAPGTEQGDRLIAHEMAHIAQQRKPGPLDPELAAELDADAAADAVLRGGVPRIRARVAAGPPHAFESWEHRELGDAYGGENRRIRLPNGVELTYGQVVALSGDFYRSPEALLRAPRSEVEAVLRVMATERAEVAASPVHRPSQAESDANNADYELATRGRSHASPSATALAGDPAAASGPHGEVREGEHVESGAPGAEASYLDLASSNLAHFSPENVSLNWIPKHQLALDLARQAWRSRHPGAVPAPMTPGRHAGAAGAVTSAGLPATTAAAAKAAPGRPDPSAAVTPAGLASAEQAAPKDEQAEAQAWLAAAFADHFLTDAFAAGHLVSGSVGRTLCQKFFTANESAIKDACLKCAIADGMSSLPAEAIIWALSHILKSRAPSLLLKTVHDYYNRSGVDVRNVLGQVWKTYGDAHLGGSPDTLTMAKLATKASRDAVQDVLATGGTTRAQAALDYLPKMARVTGGTFEPIAAFSVDPGVWNPALADSLSPYPVTNGLYRMIKGNIGPMARMYIRIGARWVRALPGRVGRAVVSGAKTAGRWVGRRAEDVGRALARAWHWVF